MHRFFRLLGRAVRDRPALHLAGRLLPPALPDPGLHQLRRDGQRHRTRSSRCGTARAGCSTSSTRTTVRPSAPRAGRCSTPSTSRPMAARSSTPSRPRRCAWRSATRLPYFLARASAHVRPALLMMVMLPFWTSFLLRVYAWKGILADQGLLNQLLLALGLTSEPIQMLLHRRLDAGRHDLCLPALHGAAAVRRPGQAGLPPAGGGARTWAPRPGRPSGW